MATVEERLATLETKVEEQGRRLMNLDDLVQSVARIAYTIESMQLGVDRIEEKVGNVDTRLKDVEDKPGKWGIKAWAYVLTATGGFILAILFDLIRIKLGV